MIAAAFLLAVQVPRAFAQASNGDYIIYDAPDYAHDESSPIRYRASTLQVVCEQWGDWMKQQSPAHASWITTSQQQPIHSMCYHSHDGNPGGGSGAGYNYQWVENPCDPGTFRVSGRHGCYRLRDIFRAEPRSCPSINNPIYPLTGVKSQEIELGFNVGGQPIRLTYDTSLKTMGATNSKHWGAAATVAFGPLWSTNLHKSIALQSPTGLAGAPNSSVLLQRGAGVVATAASPGAGSCSSGGTGGASYSGLVGRPYRVAFNGAAATLVDAKSRTVEVYDNSGAVVSVSQASGGVLTYTYSSASTPAQIAPLPGLLIAVSDAFGHSVEFTYEQPAGSATARIANVLSNQQQAVQASYDASGNLASLQWADGSVRSFLYEHPLSWPLTGIRDENERRYATYGYDAAGRAISTEHAGGVLQASVTYATPPVWKVTETVSGNTICREHTQQAPTGTYMVLSLGQASDLGATVTQGKVGLTSQSQVAGSGCAASASRQSFDTNGNVASRDDFNGGRVCYQHDLTRNLELVRVEGLAAGASCSVTAAGATLPPNSRKVTTQWHPDWELKTRTDVPGLRTTYVYNGQPDPINGNALASCAPVAAVLPNGKPIAVLCKQVEQATTDANGAAGSIATVQTGVANRVTTWTYNQWGQVLTEDGPRTDVNDITSYTYYSDTSFNSNGAAAEGHTKGDLASATNAAGQTTLYAKYNRHGQLLASSDANGVLTVNTYDLRRRLLSTTVAGQATAYTYDAVGQLKRVTLPNGSWVGYDYDDAHRQVALYDNRGNRIKYTLDNAGNRTKEEVHDASGTLKRQAQAVYDALGRVQQTAGVR